MSLSTELSPQPSAKSHVAYNLAGLTLLVLLLAVGFAYLIDQAGRAGGVAQSGLDDGNPIVQTIGGRELDIPQNWFRYGEQIRGGFASQVDLEFNLELAQIAKVEVTLLPRSRARASSELLDRVYLHQFGAEITQGHPGLVGKPLMPQEGYVGETVWYDALSPNPFVAKCAAAIEPNAPDTCLRTVHLQSGIAAVLKFDATALDDWRRFDDKLARWLGQIGAL